MRTDCKKRRTRSKGTKNLRSKIKSHHDTTSADVILNPADDNHVIKARNDNDGNLLPSWTPWIVAVCTLVIRVYYVTNPANWWVLHPDEVFQSMDVAHSEAYGYGFRPFEFISPPKGDNLSHYQVKETILEMSALRSPLYPQLLALIAKLFNSFGMADQPFMVWRIFHVFVTSSLPLAASLFVRASGQSSDVVALSSILIGFSSHLSVFGTHTIINSFISPFIFLSLSWLVSLLRSSQEKVEIDTIFHPSHQDNDQYDVTDEGVHCNFANITESSSRTTDTVGISTRRRNCPQAPPKELPFEHSSSISCDPFSERKLSSDGMLQMRNSTSSDSGYDNRSNSSRTSSDAGHSDGENIDENRSNYIENGDHNSTYDRPASNCHPRNEKKDSVSCYNFLSCKQSCVSRRVRSSLNTTFDFGAGFFLGISIYIRPDSCLFVAIVMLANVKFNIDFFSAIIKRSSSWIFITGAFASILLGIGDDFYFYQDRVISPWQWFKFNVLSTLASRLFGTSGATFYVSTVFFGNAGVTTLSVIFMSYIIFSVLSYSMVALERNPSVNSFCKICKENGDDNNFNQQVLFGTGQKLASLPVISATNTRYTCSAVLVVLIFTYFGHKEERFMHDVLVLYFVIISGVLINGIQIVKYLFTKKVMLFFLTMSYCLSQWQAMPDGHESGVNQCLHFVSKQNDVRGLFLEHTFSSTFSYSLIHRDIPLLTSLQKDFQEFDDSSVISSNRQCFIQGDSCNASFVSLNTVSNIIHSSNSRGIVKYLIESHRKYNYAIISSSKEFFQPAYTKVYATESYSVWRFTDMKRHKRHLLQMSKEMMPDASQHAIQEYEAERLKQLGRFWVALDRFKSAQEHSPTTTKILASMSFCFQSIGMMREARQAFAECVKKGDKNECAKGNEARVRDAGSGKVI